MRFVKLTIYSEPPRETYVNLDLVTTMGRRKDHTMIYFASDSEDFLAVVEPPDFILTKAKHEGA